MPGPIRHLEVQGSGTYGVTISKAVLLLGSGAMDSVVRVLSSVSVWPGRTAFKVFAIPVAVGGIGTEG